MKDSPKWITIAALGCLIALPTWAVASASDSVNVFENIYPSDDLSITYLNLLFGPLNSVGLHLTPNSLYFILIKILIFPLLFASAMGTWLVYSATSQSAHEGAFLGQKLASTTVVVRSVIGMSLLTPDATGYAMIQKIMMTVIMAGIGLANTLWGTLTEQYSQGVSLYDTVSPDADDQLIARHMISYAVLTGYLKQQLLISDAYAGPLAVSDSDSCIQLIANLPGSINATVPLNIFEYTGSVNKDLVQSRARLQAIVDDNNALLQLLAGDPMVTILVDWMVSHPADLVDDVGLILRLAGLAEDDIHILMRNNYKLTRQQLLKVRHNKNKEIESYLHQGWIVAGSLYWKLSSSPGKDSSYSAVMRPTYAGTQGTTGSLSDLQEWLVKLSPMNFNNKILSYNIENLPVQMASYGTDKKIGKVKVDSPVDAYVAGIDFSFNSLDNTFNRALHGHDPLIMFIQDCQNMMKSVLIFFMSSVMLLGAGSLVMGSMSGTYPTSYFIFYVCASLFILIMTFTFIFIPPAAMGGYYLPLIPVLIYTGAALSWMIKVVEAIIAAPFIALALIEPTQDELGRAESALSLTLHVMLKPALMVIGLILGGRLVTIALASFSLPLNAYLTYKDFTVNSSGFILEQIIIYIFLNQLVVAMVIALANRSFSLIYKIPDQVFSWIGHREQGTDVAGMLSETQQGAEQGIQMMTQIFKIGSSVGKVSLEAMNTLAENKR